MAQIQEAVGKWIDELKGTAGKADEAAGRDFCGRLCGQDVTLPGVRTRRKDYVKRSEADLKTLRAAFDSRVRGQFLKDLASDPSKVADLRRAGLKEADIADMAAGKVPYGWQVHHKLPLDDGGTNDLANLVLAKNDPYHKVFTNAQKALTKGMQAGDRRLVDFPFPEGFVYPPG